MEISRAEYHSRLHEALKGDADIHGLPLCEDPYSVVQRRTQTS